ncbi:hypothetical protein NBE99_05495 [Thermosynechococcus sp. HN-54]|uniref:hypothetical protein n=1 Tax=Thermosynechococcus sp. HN-54 TaxID=2933959 RepID=UPI00202CB3E1|nr:hypothetical protein [Thermosynechococcus sp. HN-54]URR36589.1 hypothetical protein NBE99_05495 [Thermosynechococcus sp. HN-54]
MKILEHLQQVRDRLRQGEFTSEAMVSQGILLPALQALGWPVFDTQVVIPEYSVAGHLVSFALCHPAKRPSIFIEVKLNSFGTIDYQLLENTLYHGVPMVIFTDGSQCSLYVLNEQSRYEECCFCKFNLLESDLKTVVEHFIRYLQYERVSSGEALKAARSDYQHVARDRQILGTLPQAWEALLAEPDELLVELLADKTKSLCGHRPDLGTCQKFIRKMCNSSERPQPVITPPSTHRQIHNGEFWVKSQGQVYPAKHGREVMLRVFQLLATHDPEFLERFAAQEHGRKRRYVARNKTDLYPGRPDLIKGNCEQIIPGWWLGTNCNHQSMNKIIQMALEVTTSPLKKTLQWRIGEYGA